MRIPLIYFKEGDQSVEDQDAITTRFHSQGPSVPNAWAGDLITVHMLGLFHPAFYSMSYRNQSIWQTEFRNLQVADYDLRRLSSPVLLGHALHTGLSGRIQK